MLLVALASLLACSETAPPDEASEREPAFPTSREAWRWPFTADSPWNLSVGAGLTFADADDPCTRAVRSVGEDAWVNAETWSHPVYRAAASDPILPIEEDDAPRGEVATPADASPSAPVWPDGDAHLHLVHPDGETVTELWRARRDGEGWDVDSVAVVDLRSSGIGTDGVRIYGGSGVAGLIRDGEPEDGIRHALALSLPLDALSPTYVWPATSLDTSREDEMLGAVPIGQFVALPPDTPDTLAATPAGRALLRALRDYGAYVVDHAANFALYAEPGLEDTIDPARDDLDALRARLACATNNTADAPGGPGERARPPAPPFE